jgi:hypothetical protein
LKTPSADVAATRYSGRESFCEARDSAWMPVPCESALTHTAGAPLNGKKLSHAMPPARGETRRRVSSSSSVSAVFVRLLRDFAIALAEPNVPSHWGWMP